jgi:hypothetical protein
VNAKCFIPSHVASEGVPIPPVFPSPARVCIPRPVVAIRSGERPLFCFDESEFEFWRKFLGGFNLDASASPGFQLLPDFCAAAEYRDSSFEGRRVWACPPPLLIPGFVCKAVLAQRDFGQTTMLLAVPVRPKACWWSCQRKFILLIRMVCRC